MHGAAVCAHHFYVCCFTYLTLFCYGAVYGLYIAMPLCYIVMFVNMYHFVSISWTIVINLNSVPFFELNIFFLVIFFVWFYSIANLQLVYFCFSLFYALFIIY